MPERFSASVAGRHMTCHASANLELAIPGWVRPVEDRTKDNAANRGSNMHDMFARVMDLPKRDMEMMIRAMRYVADIRSQRRFQVLTEHSVQATWLVSEPWTTVDLCFWTQDEMHIFDLKTGAIPVEVVGNEQLLFYAVTLAALAPKAAGVQVHIVQPWADNMSSWFVPARELAVFADDALRAEKEIAAGDVTFTPSDHCTFCPANPHSRAAEKGMPLCPPMMQLLYPKVCDEDEILAL